MIHYTGLLTDPFNKIDHLIKKEAATAVSSPQQHQETAHWIRWPIQLFASRRTLVVKRMTNHQQKQNNYKNTILLLPPDKALFGKVSARCRRKRKKSASSSKMIWIICTRRSKSYQICFSCTNIKLLRQSRQL